MLAQAVNLAQAAFLRFFGFQNGGADGSAPGVMRRHEEGALLQTKRFAESSRYTGVPCHCADQSHRPDHRPAFDNAALEISRYGIAEAAQDLGRSIAFLLRVDHVALGEYGAASGDARGTTRPA